ncbi:MAG: class I SAM-dependent methyltransferase [Betaproteobacteria bacterium]
MISDAHYRAKQRHRGRGVAELVRRTGDVVAEIDRRLAERDVVRVLELGCGYGTLLLDLRQRYGARMDLHGLNRSADDGNADILRRNGIERGMVAVDGEPAPPLPMIHHADVARGLPFGDARFDLVVSQVAWLYFGDKAGVVREVCRVLRDDGLALIDADEMHPALPPEYGRLVEIWQDGRVVPFGDYLRRFGAAFVAADEGEYLRFGKLANFADDLELVLQVDVSEIDAEWDGVKCVYRMRY